MIRFATIVSSCMQEMEGDAFRVQILETSKEKTVQFRVSGYQKRLFAMDSITVQMVQDCAL